MATTIVITPDLSDAQILDNFGSETRFCIVVDHYNTSPTGWPNQKQIIQQHKPLIEILMQEFSNTIFLTNYWRDDFDSLDNVHFFSPWFLYQQQLLKKQNFTIDKNKDTLSIGMLGGKTRPNRILASHWLAKNYPLDQLVHNWRENNSLLPIRDLINMSPYYSSKHIKRNIFLKDTWLPTHSIGTSDIDRFIKHFLPNIFKPTLLSIVIESSGLEFNNNVGEKTLYSFASGSLIFLTGSFQIDAILKRIGFDIFDDIFDYKHLQSTDRYALTIEGFENNKNILCNHELIKDLWHTHQSRILKNHILAYKSDDITKLFVPQIKIYEQAIKYINPIKIKNLQSYGMFRGDFL